MGTLCARVFEATTGVVLITDSTAMAVLSLLVCANTTPAPTIMRAEPSAITGRVFETLRIDTALSVSAMWIHSGFFGGVMCKR